MAFCTSTVQDARLTVVAVVDVAPDDVADVPPPLVSPAKNARIFAGSVASASVPDEVSDPAVGMVTNAM